MEEMTYTQFNTKAFRENTMWGMGVVLPKKIIMQMVSISCDVFWIRLAWDNISS
jgi:hypothetical protein